MAHERDDSGNRHRIYGLPPETIGYLVDDLAARLIARHDSWPFDGVVDRLLSPSLAPAPLLLLAAPTGEDIDGAQRTIHYLGGLRCPGPQTDRRNAERDNHNRHPSRRYVPSPGLFGGRCGLGREAHPEVTAGRDPRGGGSPQRRGLWRMDGTTTIVSVGAPSECRPARVVALCGPRPGSAHETTIPDRRGGIGADSEIRAGERLTVR